MTTRIVCLLMMYAGLLAVVSCGSEDAKTAAPEKKGPATLVAEVVLPEVSDLQQQSTSTGTFVAEDQVQISSETSGYLKKLYFTEGAYKAKGALLAKINDAELQAQKKKLEVELDYAKSELARARKLGDLQAIRAEEVDRLKNAADVIAADIMVMDAQIAKTNVYAPFSGRVGVKMLSEGAYVSPGTGMAELHRLDPIKLEFFIPEKQAGTVTTGDEITFTIPASKDTFRAEVYLVSPTLDEQNRSLRMRCRLSNKKNLFLPGGYAEVQYSLQSKGGSLLIPAEAIIPVLEGQKVLVVENGLVKSRPVEVGMRTSTSVQILGGITERDSVLVTGILGATDGMQVKAKLKEAR
ncbi:efflux RND transporter periplasmic adaptor subunit [Neolewinella aurantiaca]|uniref:Efflux RND transporter periplasmic adaptor subunit n=1 Tax=Neolewinella aurantiaca TaxID=2602767 RepID=A0A5C7FL41_9BACT|nr:efflux RND transporter periplasmic adaptor subunit [Neolewinella aurantiaca]TXF90753.1 efflux RND transporter periplasmic adaptor subunit [Neolewinella aurantiaca]